MKIHHNQRGQMIVEAVLLMVVLLGVTSMVSQFMKDNKIAAKMTIEPWQKLSGMIECGTWHDCHSAPGLHPSTRNRNLSSTTSKL